MNISSGSVLFIIPSLKPGGAEYQTLQQVQQLQKENYTIYLLVLSRRKTTLQNQVPLPHDRIFYLDLGKDTLSFFSAFSIINLVKAVSIVRRIRCRAIIANLPLGHWFGRIIKAFAPGTKLLTYHRSLQFAANPIDTAGKRLFFFFQRLLAKRYDDVSICISEAVKENIREHFVLNNPVIVYNSVQDQYNKYAERKPLNESILIVIPGRLHPSKGHQFFIKTFKSIVETLQLQPEQCSVVIAGGGPIKEDLDKIIIKIGLREFVSITGTLDNPELLRWIANADLVVIPSIHEGLGNVAIEALMLDKTVLASDAGGLKEVIMNGVNGYTFSSAHEEKLAEVLGKMIIGFPKLILPQGVARTSYLEKFSLDAHISKLKSVIRQARAD